MQRTVNKRTEPKGKVMNDQFDARAKGLVQSLIRRKALKKFGVGLAGIALTTLGLANTVVCASLSGRALEDLTGNGISADDLPIQGRAIRLFRDNGDNVFNAANDTLIKSETTRLDG